MFRKPGTKIAPSAIESPGSGMTSDGSTSFTTPNPEQAGQAPDGLLKENNRGSISGSEILQSMHAKVSENVLSSHFSFSFSYIISNT